MSKTREPETKDAKRKFVVQPNSLKHKKKTVLAPRRDRRNKDG